MTQPFRSPSAPKVGAPTYQPGSESFDYTRLEANVAEQARTAAQRFRQKTRRTLEALIGVGEELRVVKQALSPSSFRVWLREELGWTERTARTFLAVAEHFGPKKERIAGLPIDPTAAYVLARSSVPEGAIEAALQRAERGERITATAAREILDNLRNGHQDAKRKWSPTILRVRLVETLEFFRREWERGQISGLAQQLREFADSLEEPQRHRAKDL